jgi:hypothetical protein
LANEGARSIICPPFPSVNAVFWCRADLRTAFPEYACPFF